MMAILDDALGALRVEHAALPITDTARRAAKEAFGNHLYELISEADAFMAGVRRYAEESTGGQY